MVKVLEVDLEKDKESRQEFSSFFPSLPSKYSDGNFVSYVVTISPEEKGYLFRQENHCLFYILGKKEAIPFDVDENGGLIKIFYKDCEINYEESSIKKGNLESSLSIEMKDYEDLYNGEVSFVQKRLDTKEVCIISYNHMCYNKINSPIYNYHTKDKTSVILFDGWWYKEFVPCEIKRDSFLYNYLVATGVLSEKPIEDCIRFYQKYSFLGKFFTLPLLQRGMSRVEMDSFLLSRGFSSEIPSLLLDVYNERDAFLKMISEVCLLMKEINDKKEDTKRMVVSTKQD